MPQKIDADFARRFLENLYAAVNVHDANAVAALCCKDIVWEDPGAPDILRGRDAVQRFHRDTLFPAFSDLKIALLDGPYLSLDGTGVAARSRLSGTMTGTLSPPGFAPTDGPIAFETAEFSHFEGGLLVHHHVVLNMFDVARQIGAAPKAGSVGERIGVWLQHIGAHRLRRQRRAARA
jgi:predicted ester cyclase